MNKTPSSIKFYLRAKNPESLKMLMLQNNVKYSAYHHYDIVFANGYWYAWFEQNAENLLKEQAVKIANN